MNEDLIHDETVDNNTSNTDFDNETTELTDKKGGFGNILLKIFVGIFKLLLIIIVGIFKFAAESAEEDGKTPGQRIKEALERGRDLTSQ